MTFEYDYINANMLTPLAVYKGINANFLLESAQLERGRGRYSIIVRNVNFAIKKVIENKQSSYIFEKYKDLNPKSDKSSYNLARLNDYDNLPAILEKFHDSIESLKNANNLKSKHNDFDFLDLIALFRQIFPPLPKDLESLPLPFGGLGFVGYEFFDECESVRFQDTSLYDAPQALFVFPQECIIFDHFFDSMYIVICDGDNAKEQLKKTKELIDSITISQTPKFISNNDKLDTKIIYEDSKEWYESNVKQIKEEIYNGTFLQCVLSRAIALKSNMNPLYFYESLRHNNPSPYMYYLDFSDFIIIGASPEVMLQCKDNVQLLRPIAGTRKRGKTPQEDKMLEQELLLDEKENAEHLMLVDLGRNDIGKNAEIGQVKLNAFRVIERYSSVMHIVSEVVGKIAKDKSVNDCFKACFPAGTVSGAPKIEAISKLTNYEKHLRSIYSGAIMYFTLDGNLDSAITLRSAVFKDNIYYLQAGAGIVIDSNPTNEYIETCNKMKALYDILMQTN